LIVLNSEESGTVILDDYVRGARNRRPVKRERACRYSRAVTNLYSVCSRVLNINRADSLIVRAIISSATHGNPDAVGRRRRIHAKLSNVSARGNNTTSPITSRQPR
jgi:hypothetical protein